MRRKKTIPLIQNFWNKHLSGTHCCWLLFRWCICRADHQSNSRFQLLLCCSKCCFYKNNADKQMVKKYNTTSLMWWHNWETQGMKMWFLWVPKLVTTTATNEQVWAKKQASIGSRKETFIFSFKMQRIKAKKLFTWKNSNVENSPGVSDQVESHEPPRQGTSCSAPPAQGYPSELLPSANKEKLILELLRENTDGEWPAENCFVRQWWKAGTKKLTQPSRLNLRPEEQVFPITQRSSKLCLLVNFFKDVLLNIQKRIN